MTIDNPSSTEQYNTLRIQWEKVPIEAKAKLIELALQIIKVIYEMPENVRTKLGIYTKDITTGGFLLAEYGLFLGTWSHFELTIEFLIMKELKLSNQDTSIMCAGLGFNAKMQILYSLLNRNPDNAKGVTLLRQAQELAARNSFAHGFIHYDTDTARTSLITREVKNEYFVKSRELDTTLLGNHIMEFMKKAKEILDFFQIGEETLKPYIKSILSDSVSHAERARLRRESLTNSQTAKRARRPRKLSDPQA